MVFALIRCMLANVKKNALKDLKNCTRREKEAMFITMEIKQKEIKRLEELLGEKIEDTEDLELAIKHLINHVQKGKK